MELILTHNFSDFDGLAAQLAASLLLPTALPVLSPQLHDNAAEFVGLHRDELPFRRPGDLPAGPEAVTRLVLVDTDRVHGNPGYPAQTPTLIIDHHPADRPSAPWEQRIVGEAGATVTLLVGRLMEGGVKLRPLWATLMLLGIYEDTGGLSFSGTTAADLRCAAWLLDHGADLAAVGLYLRRPMTADQEQVFAQVQEALRTLDLGGWPVVLAATHIARQVDGLAVIAHRLIDVYEPAALALCISIGSGGTQVILRGDGEAVDVGEIARRLGGGGHRAAAAAFVRERPAVEVMATVEALLGELLRPPLNAARLMSAPAQTVRADAPLARAAERLERTGLGALPVVDAAGMPVGLLGRRELAKAMRHGLREAVVRTYMWRGITVVGPDTPADDLRRLMAEEERGRILVARDERLLGIITREDLLRATESPPSTPARPAALAERLAAALAPDRLGLLRRAGQLAEDRGWEVYLVGGPVRDLLLGRPVQDIDLVVEGDAPALATALAGDSGAALGIHEQFRTATLTMPDGSYIDVVTARIEFYEHPTALPEVAAASLRHDLHRRDFTINTLALGLAPASFAQLYDFYGGGRDLQRGLIRVLHNLSFIDDPTRVLRAARLAARLSFTIEPRTHALIQDALEHGVLGRTTAQRIRQELRRTLAEAQPERAIQLMDELGILRALHPALRWHPEIDDRFAAARRTELWSFDSGLLLLVYDMDPAERVELAERLAVAGRQRGLLADLAAIDAIRPHLAGAPLPPGQLDRLLHGTDELALRVAALAAGPLVARQIERYLHELRPIATLLNGHDLRELGLPPGPRYAELLADLRVAQLDGQVADRPAALGWVRQQAGL